VKRAVAVLALLTPLLGAGSASACACCAEPGTWYQARTPFGANERDALAQLHFTTAHTRATPAGRPAPTFRVVSATLTGGTWRWQLGGGTTLTFQLPSYAFTFAADIHDGKLGGGGGPLLYKELRLTGRLSATGRLRGTHYFLVLQGRGNNCLNAGDFRSWYLDVSAARQYSMYGTFR
jgi:hypothetical protein